MCPESTEKDLISRYLAFYESLDSGQRPPTTDAQRHFVSVCLGKAVAESPHEKAWILYKAQRTTPSQVIASTQADKTIEKQETTEPQSIAVKMQEKPARYIQLPPRSLGSGLRRFQPVSRVDEDIASFFEEEVDDAVRSVSGNLARKAGEG